MSNWSLRRKIGLGAILSFLGTIVISGIIGNRADALFVWLWGSMTTSITPQSWPLIIALVLLIIILGCFLLFFWRRNSVLSSGLDTMNNVVKLDESLLSLLPSLISAQDREGEMKRLLLELLRDVTRAFAGDVHRASILLPDAAKEYLRVWVQYQMPEESVNKRQFYIGGEIDRKRGIAGEVFSKSQLRVVHIYIMKDNGWKADSSDYLVFDTNRPYPPYRSFVGVPIVGGEETIGCLGVVCFDSESETVFDSTETQDMLLMLGRRIATALSIYQQLPLSFKQHKHMSPIQTSSTKLN